MDVELEEELFLLRTERKIVKTNIFYALFCFLVFNTTVTLIFTIFCISNQNNITNTSESIQKSMDSLNNLLVDINLNKHDIVDVIRGLKKLLNQM